MKSVIAIVGRPNVGKSTLFNRLTRSRNALVADQPGVTRDRQYGIAQYGEHTFILVDTGGLIEAGSATNSIENLIIEQSLQAVREADAVIWLVDGRDGLTAADETLAMQLRPLCKHLYLAVNKTEGLDADIVTAEFHALGVGKPYAISAQRGSGITILIADIISALPQPTDMSDETDQGLRITVLGRPNVGKSTLVNRILGEERMLTFDQPGTTRDSIAIPFERNGKSYVLIDTAGVRRRARVTGTIEKISVIKTLQAIDNTDIVVLITDAQDSVTEQDATLLGLVVESGKSLIIAINKWDGLESSQRTLIRAQFDRKLGFIDYACVHYISALHGSGVGKMFESIDKIGKSIAITPSTSVLTDFLHQSVESHQPPMIRGRRIKLRYAHLGGHNPLRIIIHGNQTGHVPDSYRRYLSNNFRKLLRLTGIPVLIEFKQGANPYKDGPYQGKRNNLARGQTQKRRRSVRHVRDSVK